MSSTASVVVHQCNVTSIHFRSSAAAGVVEEHLDRCAGRYHVAAVEPPASARGRRLCAEPSPRCRGSRGMLGPYGTVSASEEIAR